MRTVLLLLALGCGVGCQTTSTSDTSSPTDTSEPSTRVDTGSPDHTTQCEAPRVVFNEMVASNVHGIVDEDGDTPDWLELFNASDATVDLGGWILGDGGHGWPLPAISLGVGEFLLVHASGKDRGRGKGVQSWDTRVDQGHTWRYREVTGSVDAGWVEPGYDDGAWELGPSGFGRGDGDDETRIEANQVQIRTTLALSPDELDDLLAVVLHVDFDDGFVAWVNGVEVARENLGAVGSEVSWDTYATSPHEADLYDGRLPRRIEIDPELFEDVNTLALTVVNYTAESSDLSLIPFLSLGFGSERAGHASPWLDPAPATLHTDFKLGADGERITLLDRDGCVADQVATGQLWTDQSFGRTPDGGTAFGYFLEPTPGAPNTTESRPGYAEKPVFSPPPGFYPGGAEVSVTAGAGAVVRVLSGGVEPSELDPTYTGPIALDGAAEAQVLRARAFEPGLWPSPIATATYFHREAGPLPVVSLVTDPPNLWDWETGIYVMGDGADPDPPHRNANFWQDWEVPVHASMWEPDGSAGFAVDAGVEIFGGNSRARPQKSLKIKMRSGYGDPVIAHEVFPGLGVNEFDDMILRQSGSDWLGCSEFRCYFGSFFRDALMHRLTEGADMDTLAYRPAELYINGEYWGMQNLRERAHANWVKRHYGIENIDLVERRSDVREGDEEHYQAMLTYLREADPSDPAAYATVRTLMDVDQFANYNAFEIWFDNEDWPGNNVRYWRPHTNDGRWRWLLYDLDFGIGLWGASPAHDKLAVALADDGVGWPNPPESTELLRLLMAMPQFRTNFVNRYADLMNTLLVPARTQAMLAEMAAEIEPVMPRHIARWGTSDDGKKLQQLPAGTWEDTLSYKHAWLGERSAWATQHLLDDLGLAGTWTLQLQADPPGSGSFELAAVTVDAPFTGTYFLGIPVTVTAIPSDGYQFVGWSDQALPATPTVTVDPATSLTLTAVFQP